MNNQFKTIFLLGALSALLIALGGALGQNYLYMFTILAVVMNFISYFFSDKIVLAMNRAKEVSVEEAPRLHAMVEELSARANIPKPRVFLIPQAQANAFATGRDPAHGAVAVTEGIMRLLPERELRGVIAHELAHIKNRDILISSVAATIASAVTFIASAVRWGAIFGGYSRDDDRGGSPLALLAMAVVAPIAALLIQLGISRSREFVADATGAEISGDPESLARALEHLHEGVQAIPANVAPATASMYIVNPFTGKGLMSLFSTHPPVEERVARLRGLYLDSTRVAL
ncbi:MAG: zinc metalloprotease HtpX [Terriglobales bacterium]